jgi:histidinol-phosphatase (PHP family)
MFDYHVHSNFSADCSIEMETMIKSAIQNGLKEICFTDHNDQDYKDSSISFDLDVENYCKEMDYYQKKYENAIKIKKGIELGIQPHIIDNYEKLIRDNEFDFVITSIHTCGKKDIHKGDFFIGKTPKECYRQYFEELYFCAKEFNNFNIIGHLDLLKRYANHVLPQNTIQFFDIIEALFKDIIYRGKGIEVNTSGLRSSLKETLPSIDILKLYKSLGGEIITIGSDSHFTEHLGYRFPEILDNLKNIGFNYITTFENQKPIFIKI